MTGSPREFILALGHKAKIWVSSWDISFETAGPQGRRSSISKQTNRLPIVMMGSENNSPVLSRLGAVKADTEKVEYVMFNQSKKQSRCMDTCVDDVFVNQEMAGNMNFESSLSGKFIGNKQLADVPI